MAGPVSRQDKRPGLGRCLVFTFVALMILFGLAILITWLVLRPRELVYTMEMGKVSGFDIHKDHLNGTFNFYLRAYNPNRRVALYYDSIQASVLYDGQTLVSQTLQPFYQPRHNTTRMEVKPIAHSEALKPPLAKDLRLEKASGEVQLEVRLKARIRFKVGVWKSAHYTLKIYCTDLQMHLDTTKVFKGKRCDVDT